MTGRLLRLGERLATTRAGLLAGHGLSVGEFDVLATIRRREGQGGSNPRDLQRAVMISSGGMTKRLDRLEAANLLERRPDPDDRRGVRIMLTDDGRELIDRVLPALLDAERTALEDALPRGADRHRLAALLRSLLTDHEDE